MPLSLLPRLFLVLFFSHPPRSTSPWTTTSFSQLQSRSSRFMPSSLSPLFSCYHSLYMRRMFAAAASSSSPAAFETIATYNLIPTATASADSAAAAAAAQPNTNSATTTTNNNNNNNNNNIRLIIARGSVLDFEPRTPAGAAIVNAANEGCLGGGGVDGAITNAGGQNLRRDREDLPIIDRVPVSNDYGRVMYHEDVRCRTGGAVMTGPGQYGEIMVRYVIHAVGPNYFDYEDERDGHRDLRRAYQASLHVAVERNLTEVAFSLLSSGIFRGRVPLKTVFKHSVKGIKRWATVMTARRQVQAQQQQQEEDNGENIPEREAESGTNGNMRDGSEAPSSAHKEDEETEAALARVVGAQNGIETLAPPEPQQQQPASSSSQRLVSVEEIYLCAFTEREYKTLMAICDELLEPCDDPPSPSPFSEKHQQQKSPPDDQQQPSTGNDDDDDDDGTDSGVQHQEQKAEQGNSEGGDRKRAASATPPPPPSPEEQGHEQKQDDKMQLGTPPQKQGDKMQVAEDSQDEVMKSPSSLAQQQQEDARQEESKESPPPQQEQEKAEEEKEL